MHVCVGEILLLPHFLRHEIQRLQYIFLTSILYFGLNFRYRALYFVLNLCGDGIKGSLATLHDHLDVVLNKCRHFIQLRLYIG